MASSSRPNHDTYQVFLSFRGDTRYAFTDHLYHALRRAGVKTFRDEEEIESGQQLKPGIDIAIINSKASIVVLSPDYANSRWCLNELCLILEQKEHGHAVIPVFYLVDPSDVRHQTGSFAMKELNGTNDDVKRWKEALQEVGNLKGDVLHLVRQTYETDFIDKVVEKVKRKLYLKLEASTPSYIRLIGMESRIEDINSVLKSEQYDAIAIFGIGGIGKTTIAYNIYNLNKYYFESSSFVSNIGENYKGGLLRLQEKILKDLCWKKEISISCHIEGTNEIVKVLQTTKVLIVLDDISDRGELDTLLGTNVFHRESKIIITTRLSNIDEWFGSKSSRCKMHALESLNVQESLELLSQHAFPSGIPIDDFKVLAKQLSQYCGGNPLALKVVGSSLFVSDDDPCKRKDVIDSWLEKVNQLNSFKGNIDGSIQLVLQKSFDSLPELSHKELFLHIACFFVGESEEHVISILKDDLYTNYGIGILVKRGLLTVSHSGHIMMHQLIQEMGRKIVCEESKDPEKRSRVWNDDESYDLLSKGKVSDTIEGLSLDIQKVKKKWIKKYEHHKLDLVGDEITKGRSQNIQMLYEYGIMSTYLQGIKDQNMMTYKYTSSSNLLSFCVPSHHEHNRIQGLHVSCLYKSLDSKDKDRWLLLAKISNRSKGFTWIYNPVVYYQPGVDEDAVWLSYWPIGNKVEAGDEIHVDIIVDDGVMVMKVSKGSKKVVVRVRFFDDKRKQVIMKAVCTLSEVDSIYADVASGRLIVSGDVDPAVVVRCVRKIDKEVVILHVSHAPLIMVPGNTTML